MTIAPARVESRQPAAPITHSGGILRCTCGHILGHSAGRYTIMSYRRREYILIDVRLVVCEDCGRSFAPDNPRVDVPFDLDTIAQGTEFLRCQTPDCSGITLGQIGEGIAIINARRRIVVARAFAFVSCDRCRVGIDYSGPAPMVSAIIASPECADLRAHKKGSAQ